MYQDVPPPPPAADLGEIVVTAARLPPAAGDAAFSVLRLDETVLDRHPAGRGAGDGAGGVAVPPHL